MAKTKHDRGKVVRWIKRFITKNGYSPSVREIGAGIGTGSTSAVLYILDELEGSGIISRTPNVARSIRINDG